MKVFRLLFSLLGLGIVSLVRGDCNLTYRDFPQSSPVLLKDGGFFAGNSEGAMTLRRSDTLTVACPGSKRRIMLNNVDSGYDVREAHCILNNTFRVDRWIGSFRNITCNVQPAYTAEDSGRRCYGLHKIYKVGYQIKSKLYSAYEACFDQNLYSTLYVKHELSPAIKTVQSGNRPKFTEGTLFGKIKMSQLYNAKTQAERLDEVLGDGMSDKYLSKKQFLSRGHLAPRADFPTYVQQRATFHYVNTAPQWIRANAGDWAALEDALRRRAVDLGRPLTVYTGTHGVLTLEGEDGRQRPIYLTTDENNNGLVPVPLYFYKLVYDSKTKTAAAFMSINSQHYSRDMIKNLTLCDDICEGNPKYNWLKWRPSNGFTSYCCEYEDFVEEINGLPTLDVRGQFY